MQIGSANTLIPFLSNSPQSSSEQPQAAAQNARQTPVKTVLSPSSTVNEGRESQSSENGSSNNSHSQTSQGETGSRLNVYG